MKISYQDKCGYRKQYWSNVYYPIIVNVFCILLFSIIIVHRYWNECVYMHASLLLGVGISLFVFCVGKLREEFKKEKSFNIVTLLYACFFPIVAFLINYWYIGL